MRGIEPDRKFYPFCSAQKDRNRTVGDVSGSLRIRKAYVVIVQVCISKRQTIFFIKPRYSKQLIESENRDNKK